MTFDSLVRKSGKGLDVSKEMVIGLEINLGGTLGTQYFADKNVTVEGTYYDGRIMRASAVNRNIFPDVGSFEISTLEVRLANQDQKFRDPKWVRWTYGNEAKLKVAFHGTRNIQDADWKTRYNGFVETFEYDYETHVYNLGIIERTWKAVNTLIPVKRIQYGDFPGMDNNTVQAGNPVPQVYGQWLYPWIGPSYLYQIPGIVIGTYTSGTSTVAYCGHAVDFAGTVYDDNVEVDTSKYITYKSGTVATFCNGTVPVCYSDLNYDIGTSTIGIQLKSRGTYSGEHARYLLHECGIADSEMGTHEFLEDRQESHLYLNAIRPAKDYLDDLCRQTGAMMYTDSEGKVRWKRYGWTDGDGMSWSGTQDRQGTRELEEKDFLNFKAWKASEHLINRYDGLYGWCPTQGIYFHYGFFDHKPSQARMGQTSYQKSESYWGYGTAWHWDPGWRYTARFRYPFYKAQFRLPMSALPLELGDYVQITHSLAPDEYGTKGWRKKPMEIVSIDEYYNDKRVEVEAWEYYPGIPMQDLLVWFSLADGAGTGVGLEMAGPWIVNYDTKYQSYEKLCAPTDFEDEMWANKINNDYVLTLDGTSQFLTNFNQGWRLGLSPGGTSGGVMGAFIKPDVLGTMCILSNDRIGTVGWEMGIKTDGSIYFACGTKGSGWHEKHSPTGLVSAGTWQAVHVGITGFPGIAPPSKQRVRFYLNGTQQGTVSIFVPRITTDSPVNSWQGLGASNVGTWTSGTIIESCRHFDGQIGDPACWITGTMWPPGKMQRIFDDLRGRYGL